MVRPQVFALFAVLGLVGCGSSIDQPEDLPVTAYSTAGAAFRMTLVMKHCSDSCATYSDPVCEVEVEGNVINIEASIAYDRNDEGCNDRCGNPVIVHCDVPSLSPGEYTVSSGDNFNRTITVR
jgi:hypothetical protein